MTKKIVGGVKDENGIYTSVKQEPAAIESTDISIDDLLKSGLQIIRKALKAVSEDVNTGMPSRETIMNLKDLMSMLKDLKKEEKDLLETLSDEQLETMLKK